MLSLFKKELNTFFGSMLGYLVISIFLLTTSLFLWVIPGGFNIIDSQRSSLKYFFELAPWLYLFLIPAITMRMFAEEKRTGTIEVLITRPITPTSIVLSKFFAALLLVLVSLIPTLLYFFSVYQLGNPVGNIDTGATWGSFIGLLFLASVYIALGLLASSITSNQVISFLVAIVLSYFFFLGFEFLSQIPLGNAVQNFISTIGINSHYRSISRGVIDSRDLIYFIAITLLILSISRIFIVSKSQNHKVNSKNTAQIILLVLLLVVASSFQLFRFDLTAEKRYSLSSISKELIKNQDKPILIEIYLTGDLPAGMKEFQEAIIEKIEDFNAYSPQKIDYRVIDVYKIKSESERNKFIEDLENSGIQPVNFGHKTTEGLSTKQMIFPGVIVLSEKKGIALNLLKNNPIFGPDENLKNSIELLEFEFASAFKNLQQIEKPVVAFLQGHGEADTNETGDIRFRLRENYTVINATSIELIENNDIEVLVIADPTQRIEEQDKFCIDQFLMKGGKILWCVDPVFASIDSLSKGMTTIAFDRDLNLRDQLFNYGVRLNADILQDAVCIEYPVNTAPVGQPTNFVSAPFYYSPLALPNPKHPVSRNLNNVFVEFASSVEPVGENPTVSKTIILATSPYGRSIQTPVEISLMSATNPPDQSLFNQPNIPIGILLEGEFNSAFANRITNEYKIAGNKLNRSKPTKIVVIADGGIIKNKVRNRNGQVQLQPLGFDQYSGQTFGNSEFIQNCITYLSDDQGIMEIRSKVVKLRMLDKVKIRDKKVMWQLINTLLPLILFIVFGIVYSLLRKKKYSKNSK